MKSPNNRWESVYDWCVENGREDLLDCWDYDYNDPKSPEDAPYDPGAEYLWYCPHCMSVWCATVDEVASGGRCPRCPRPRQIFADLYPDLAREWHPTRNGDLTPEDVGIESGVKVWWLCPTCGCEWPAFINNRVRGNGCPRCGRARIALSRSTPDPGRSFADLHPDLAGEWHPTLNGDLTPDHVKPYSNKGVWWLCPTCGHEWPAKPCDRVRGCGCPECVKKRGGNRRRTVSKNVRSIFGRRRGL